jgi:drug/metabolite transporter (DMT)-like permease
VPPTIAIRWSTVLTFYNWQVGYGSPAADRRRALVWVGVGASLWGTDPVLRRPLAAGMASSLVVLLEHLILAAALLPALWRSRGEWLRLKHREWAAVVAIAWGGSALGTILFTEAIRSGNPTTAVLLQKAQPLFAAVLARTLLGEPLGRRFWALLALAVLAAYLISFGGALPFKEVVQASVRPALLSLGAAALWGASTVFGRFMLQRIGFVTLTGLRIVAAAPFLFALHWAGSGPALPVPGARQAAGLVLLALVPGLLALLIYYRGLMRVRASRAAIAELSFPAAAALLNWAFLGARVSAVQLAGFALLWGVILNLESVRKGKVKHAE